MKNRSIDLTKGSIVKNILFLSLPIMISNLMQTVYNFIDTLWLSELEGKSREAISVAGNAISLVFCFIAFGWGLNIAANSFVSQYRGAGQNNMIKKACGQFTLIVLAVSFFITTCAYLFMDEILKVLNTPDSLLSDTKDYLFYIILSMIFMFMFQLFQSVVHGLGDTRGPMYIQVVSLTVNLILDPLLIFGIMFPRLEIEGAAIATLIARVTSLIIAVLYYKNKFPDYFPGKKDIVPDFEYIKKYIKVALPASLSHSMTSIGFLIMQGFINYYGVTVMTVYSIGNRINNFFLMPAMGVGQALSSIVGQNLGADNIERAVKSIKKAFMIVMFIMVIGCSITFFFGREFTNLFITENIANEETLLAGERMFRILSLGTFSFFPLFLLNGVFNGSGQTKAAMKFSIARLWLFRIPATYLISGYMLKYEVINTSFIAPFVVWISSWLSEHPYEGVWYAMIFSNILSGIWAYSVFRKGLWKSKII